MSAPQKYRKTGLVEAMQWTGDNIDAIWEWAGADKVYGPTENNPDWLIVGTLEGSLRCSLGDWVLRGPEGECWPVKGSIFAATYEAVSE